MTCEKIGIDNYQDYTDKYFLRSREIIEEEITGMDDPTVSMKIFTRKGSKMGSTDEVIEFLKETLLVEDPEVKVWILPEGASYRPMDPLMIIEAKASKVVDKETVYLGMLSDSLTRKNRPELVIDNDDELYTTIYNKAKELVEIAGDIPISYFGARHYHWSKDEIITKAAMDAGFKSASTDMGASTHGMNGIGTIPHFLILLCAYWYGIKNATSDTLEMFDVYMPNDIPRIILIDTFNKEITDSLMCCNNPNLVAIRLDTCGENFAEWCGDYVGDGKYPAFIDGPGVTIDAAQHIRFNLDDAGHEYIGIFLSSGFGNPKKMQAFMDMYEWHRCVGFGVGELTPSIFATSDIFAIDGVPIAKVGREAGTINYDKLNRIC